MALMVLSLLLVLWLGLGCDFWQEASSVDFSSVSCNCAHETSELQQLKLPEQWPTCGPEEQLFERLGRWFC